MRLIGMFLLALAASACSNPQPPAKEQAPAEVPIAVTRAKDEAKEIAKYPWSLEKFESGENHSATIVLRNAVNSERWTLRVDYSHLAWHRYTVLRQAGTGSTIRFEFREASFNELGDLAPERDADPAYYLTPFVSTLK